MPVSAPLADLEALINKEVPLVLADIDRQEKVCVPAARLTVCLKHKTPCRGEACKSVPCAIGFQRAKITPDMSCRIVGQVRRGPIRLSGSGPVLRLTMPVSAEVSAKDVGRIIKSETATAAAEVRAIVRLDTSADWQPTAKIDIDYSWTQKPGIELLGRRITFAGKADPALAKIIARLESELPGHLRGLGFRSRIEEAWSRAFTSISLNRRNPAAWMRVTPKRLGHGGYRVEGQDLVLLVGLEATTETFLGDRPPDPPPTPLPARVVLGESTGLRFRLPVVADYAQLEPVLERELKQLAAAPVDVPVVGPTRVRFGTPTIYTTTGGKLAVGLPIRASTRGQLIFTKGTVWFTGLPWNEPNSRRVKVRDLEIVGDAQGLSGSLLLQVARAPAVRAQLESGLAQDFEGDFQKLLVKIDRALTEKRVGDFVLNVAVKEVRNGVVQPVGQGLYMPVEAFGDAELRYRPRTEAEKREAAAKKATRAEAEAAVS